MANGSPRSQNPLQTISSWLFLGNFKSYCPDAGHVLCLLCHHAYSHQRRQQRPLFHFSFVALLPWNLFSNSLSSACSSLVSSSSLITKVYFPRSILVISTILAKIVDFLFANIVLIVYMIAYRMPITVNILWIIPIFFIQQIFTLGLALFFAASNLIYRDIQYC